MKKEQNNIWKKTTVLVKDHLNVTQQIIFILYTLHEWKCSSSWKTDSEVFCSLQTGLFAIAINFSFKLVWWQGKPWNLSYCSITWLKCVIKLGRRDCLMFVCSFYVCQYCHNLSRSNRHWILKIRTKWHFLYVGNRNRFQEKGWMNCYDNQRLFLAQFSTHGRRL